MPKIERTIDYTFQAYSGSLKTNKENEESAQENDPNNDRESESETESKYTYERSCYSKKFVIKIFYSYITKVCFKVYVIYIYTRIYVGKGNVSRKYAYKLH